jgi:hypothetical protein
LVGDRHAKCIYLRRDNKKVFGVAAADKLTHELLYNFIDRVAHAFPKLTFEVWGSRRVDVFDVYGHQVGRVKLDFIGEYNRDGVGAMVSSYGRQTQPQN